jgi:hypothetical protein
MVATARAAENAPKAARALRQGSRLLYTLPKPQLARATKVPRMNPTTTGAAKACLSDEVSFIIGLAYLKAANGGR